jgi:hypothetical protein
MILLEISLEIMIHMANDTKTTGLNLVRNKDINGHKILLCHYFKLLIKLSFPQKALAVLILTQ